MSFNGSGYICLIKLGLSWDQCVVMSVWVMLLHETTARPLYPRTNSHCSTRGYIQQLPMWNQLVQRWTHCRFGRNLLLASVNQYHLFPFVLTKLSRYSWHPVSCLRSICDIQAVFFVFHSGIQIRIALYRLRSHIVIFFIFLHLHAAAP